MSEHHIKIPKVVKIWNIVIAAEFLIFAVMLIVFYGIIEENVELFLSLNLIVFGLLKITNILIHNLYNRKLIIVDIGIGGASIGAGIYLLTNLSALFMIYMAILSGVFLLQGVYSLLDGIFNRHLSQWATVYHSLFGLVEIVISILIFIYREESGTILNLLLAGLFAVIAISRLGTSIRGYIKKPQEKT